MSKVMSNVMLVGCDLETGGLNGYETLESGERVHGALHYPILEMAFVICDDKLKELNRFSVGIWNESFLERLDPWALEKHTESGLIDQLRNATGDHVAVFSDNDSAELFVIERLMSLGVTKYDRKAKTGGILFGNSIGFDVSYLDAQMPELKEFFHYRTIDVSSIDLLRQTAWASVGLPKVKKEYAHTAMSDIQETLMELGAYTDFALPVHFGRDEGLGFFLRETAFTDIKSAEDLTKGGRFGLVPNNGAVLMSRHNPNGWKLQDLLVKAAQEIREKTEMIKGDDSERSLKMQKINHEIELLLYTAVNKQNSIFALLDEIGPDQGPEAPRMGA